MKKQKRHLRKLDQRQRKRRRSIKFLLAVVTGRPHRRKTLLESHRKQSSVGGSDNLQTIAYWVM